MRSSEPSPACSRHTTEKHGVARPHMPAAVTGTGTPVLPVVQLDETLEQAGARGRGRRAGAGEARGGASRRNGRSRWRWSWHPCHVGRASRRSSGKSCASNTVPSSPRSEKPRPSGSGVITRPAFLASPSLLGSYLAALLKFSDTLSGSGLVPERHAEADLQPDVLDGVVGQPVVGVDLVRARQGQLVGREQSPRTDELAGDTAVASAAHGLVVHAWHGRFQRMREVAGEPRRIVEYLGGLRAVDNQRG